MNITKRATAYAAVGVAIAIGGGVGAVAVVNGGPPESPAPVQLVHNDADVESPSPEPAGKDIPPVDASAAPAETTDPAAVTTVQDSGGAATADNAPGAQSGPASTDNGAPAPAPAETEAPPPPPRAPTASPTPTQTASTIPTHTPQTP